MKFNILYVIILIFYQIFGLLTIKTAFKILRIYEDMAFSLTQYIVFYFRFCYNYFIQKYTIFFEI